MSVTVEAVDEFVPKRAPRILAWIRVAAAVAGLVLLPAVLWVASVSTTSRHRVDVAIVVVLLVLLTIGAFRQQPRPAWRVLWGGAVLFGSALLLTAFGQRHNSAVHGDLVDLARLGALIAFVVAVVALLRSMRGRDSMAGLDTLIVGCALCAVFWPVLAYPGAGADHVANGTARVRSILAIVLFALAVQLLFHRARWARLLFAGFAAAAASELLVSVGVLHIARGGHDLHGALQIAVLGVLAIAAFRPVALEAPHASVEPANRQRLVTILALASVSFATPLALAWSSGDDSARTTICGVGAVVMFSLVAARLLRLADGARTAVAERGERRLSALVHGLTDAIFVVDAAGIISYASPRAGDLLGVGAADIVGRRFDRCFGMQEAGRINRQLEVALHMRPDAIEDVIGSYVDATGRERDLEMNIANRLDNRDVAGIVITLRDVTARRQLTRELERRAFRDDLTKLANRALFMDRLEVARYRSQRSGAGIAVLFIDLDDFKAVNDGLGHGAGDVLLCAVSSRLSQCLRPSDTIARLGGDEFAVLLEDVEGVQQVENTARRLLEVLQMPVEVGEMSVTVPASIGIALASDGASRSNLMRDADIALYRAKAIGKNRIVTFDATMGWEAHNRLQLRSQLESALADGALRVMYQPIVSIDSSRIVGVEALIRWEHPTMGLLLPEEFLPIAEDSGLITPIGSWVLHHACMDAAAWNAQGHDVYVSVNISARQLRESEFADVVQAALGASGLRADRLMLELTESVLIDERAGRNLVEAVAPLGVGVAIDDFGTGYSSLAYLQRFPVHVVKIDRTFISRINEHGARAVLKSMTAISDVMGYVSIAEGVESSEEASELMDLDYRFAQGFLWSEAVDAVRIGAMLSSDQPAPA